jgi:hypothetical protein
LPEWKPFGSEREVRVFDAELSSERVSPALADRCGFWDEHAVTHPWMVETFGLLGTRPGRTRSWPNSPAVPPTKVVVQSKSAPGASASSSAVAGPQQVSVQPAGMSAATPSAPASAAGSSVAVQPASPSPVQSSGAVTAPSSGAAN